MDPGGVQGVFAAGNFQETRRLNESRLAQPGHVAQLLSRKERSVLAAVFAEPAGGKLIQAGDVSQQRRAGRVGVHTHVVHARFDHLVQRCPQVLGLHVVLIQPNADIGRVDLDQFAQWILQAAADGDGPPQHGVVVGKLLAADAAGRIDAGARLVDDDVGHALVLQLALDQLGEKILGLAAGRSVTDDHHGNLMPLDQIEHHFFCFAASVGFAHQVDHAVVQQIAELVERGQFAAAAEPGIDGQYAVVVDRRLQEKVAEILGEDVDRVRLGPVGQFAADLPFEAG